MHCPQHAAYHHLQSFWQHEHQHITPALAMPARSEHGVVLSQQPYHTFILIAFCSIRAAATPTRFMITTVELTAIDLQHAVSLLVVWLASSHRMDV